MMRLSMGVLVLGAALAVAPKAAQATFLLNGNFGETIIVASASSGYPAAADPTLPDFQKVPAPVHWAASAWNAIGGAAVQPCDTGVFGLGGCAGNGMFTASVEDSLPTGALPNPAALYQTVALQPGFYRYGGEFALRIQQASVGDNESEAFLNIWQGTIDFDTNGVPVGVTGTLLDFIALSPSLFDASEFTLPAGGTSAFPRVARQFESFESLFEVPGLGTDPVPVTMQLVVLPKRVSGLDPGRYPEVNTSTAAALIVATELKVFADNLFIERTRVQQVPAPGALGVFAVALAGLAAARRARAPQA